MPVSKPNILFFMADQLAAASPFYGHALVKTPTFDRLAEGGVVFENATARARCALPPGQRS